MKLPAWLLIGSLAANVVVLAAFAFRPALAPLSIRDYFKSDRVRAAELAADEAAFRVQASAQAKAAEARAGAQRGRLWAALDSGDLKTLIAKLRAAGFSPALIRAIVGARIEAKFRAQMNALVGPMADTPYWKPPPFNSFYNSKYYESYQQIYRDRAKLMRELLGDDFFASAGTDPTEAQRRQFGNLSKAKIDMVQRIVDDYSEMTSQVRATMQGVTLPSDREKLALLESEKHADLAAILTPEELDGYEMRNSLITSQLSTALTLMDATEAEYQAIYRTQQPLMNVLYPQGGTYGPEMARQRTDAQAQVATQLAAALGPERYADYARATDYDYQQLARIGQRENLPNDTIIGAYNLRDATLAQSMSIFKSDQSYDDKMAALAALSQNAKAQLVNMLGANAGANYTQGADWLNAIGKGYAIERSADGRNTTFHSPEPPPKH